MSLGGFLAMSGVALAVGFSAGWQVHSWRDGAQQVKTVTRIERVLVKQGEATTKVATQVQAGQDRIRYVHDTILKEIPLAVPPAADPVLPFGWVRLHDAAALGLSPAAAPAGQPDDAPSGIAASVALGGVADNYAAANVCLVELKGWQDWWSAISAAKP